MPELPLHIRLLKEARQHAVNHYFSDLGDLTALNLFNLMQETLSRYVVLPNNISLSSAYEGEDFADMPRLLSDMANDYLEAMKKAVTLAQTSISDAPQMKIKCILMHDVQYRFNNGELTLDELEVEHIAYMISQGFREGELTKGNVRGWWNLPPLN